MKLWQRIGLRGRLGLALAAVAVVSVALATVFADRGLHSRLDQFAQDRLQGAATHSAELAARLYQPDGRWTEGTAVQITHLAEMNGYLLALSDATGWPVGTTRNLRRPNASAAVVVDRRRVGTVTVAPIEGQVLTGEDRALRDRLGSLHLLAGGLALALGLLAAALLAPALARPLRRLTTAARTIQRGDLQTRVAPAGGPELRELGHAFNRLAETLEHEERIRRDAAADVAHELRTPLAGIVSRIEAAQDGVLTDEHRNLDAMHTEALRLTRLVEDLGTLAEAQQPGLTLQKEMLDLRELVHERARVYMDYLKGKDIALKERLGEASVYGDRGRIVQIVDNLLSNALRYTDAGGTVTIELRQRDGEAVLVVADTGVGINGEDLPYIFERFWRGEPSRARRTGGAGIGLAIVRELVGTHDGRIDVESKPGEGSRFRVTLPARVH
jgi:two-component system, OmpR family, sensor histidine kinase BaeS